MMRPIDEVNLTPVLIFVLLCRLFLFVYKFRTSELIYSLSPLISLIDRVIKIIELAKKDTLFNTLAVE